MKDISLQLVESEAGRKMDIMLGGGRASFLPESEKPQELLNKTEPRFVRLVRKFSVSHKV